MRILIVTDAYPPEIRSSAQLMKSLADGLSDRGHRVFVATSYPQCNLAGSESVEWPEITEENEVKVLRIKTIPHHKVNFVVKGIAQLLMPQTFLRKIKKNIKENIDTVIVHSPPLPLTLTAYWVKRFYGAKYVLNLHDIFPQNAIDLGVLKWWKHLPAILLFEQMEKNAYRNADLIITPSNEHKAFIEENRNVPKGKTRVVYHWVDSGPFVKARRTGRFRKLYGLEDEFVFIFTGVFGPSQNLHSIIEMAAALKQYSDMSFLFVGDGLEKKRLIETAETRGLDNVIFKPFVPERDYPELLKDADAGIISLSSKNTTPAVPAKIASYMAASLPVIAFLHERSEGHLIIREAGCGFSTASESEEDKLKLLLKAYNEKEKLEEYGENGLRYLLKNMEKNVCIDKIEGLLREIGPYE